MAARERRDDDRHRRSHRRAATRACRTTARDAPLRPDERVAIAWHEAGHALAAELCPTHEKTQRVTILARGQAGGLALYGRGDRALHTPRTCTSGCRRPRRAGRRGALHGHALIRRGQRSGSRDRTGSGRGHQARVLRAGAWNHRDGRVGQLGGPARADRRGGRSPHRRRPRRSHAIAPPPHPRARGTCRGAAQPGAARQARAGGDSGRRCLARTRPDCDACA